MLSSYAMFLSCAILSHYPPVLSSCPILCSYAVLLRYDPMPCSGTPHYAMSGPGIAYAATHSVRDV
eukprot:12322-Rhodomonas_salina.2